MMTEEISSAGRYLTLRDYLRVLRRYRIAIVLIAAVGAAAGFAEAKSHTAMYQATSIVSFQDPAQNLALAGLSPGLVQEPAALAAENAETLTRPQIMMAVQRRLATTESVGSLSAAVSGGVSTAGLLQISAKSSSPQFAAQLANTVAEVLVSQDNHAAQAGFAAAANDIRSQIASMRATPSAANAQLPIYEAELAHLQTLSRFAQTAQLAQPAQEPTTPVSPKTLRSVLIGLALGLLLAIVVAFFRDSLDRRLRTPRDIEASFEFPTLGYVRAQGMGRIAQPASTREPATSVDVEAFRILRRNLQFLDVASPPRSVLVTSAIPEAGKTTVAGSLAFALASAGLRTLLVDCDLHRPSLDARLGIQQSPGIADFLAGEATPQQILRPIQLDGALTRNGASANGTASNGHRPLLVAIPAGSARSNSAELLSSPRFEDFLRQVAEIYDAVVIDSSPLLPVADTLEILPHVDAVVVCARESRTTREEAHAVNTVLARFPQLPAGLVVTGIKPSRGDDPAYAYSYSYS